MFKKIIAKLKYGSCKTKAPDSTAKQSETKVRIERNEIWLKTVYFHWEGRYFWKDLDLWKNTQKKLHDYDFTSNNPIITDKLCRCFKQYKKTRNWKTVLTYLIDQNNCVHDAKVKMPGFKDMYECTRCHKFIVDNKNHIKN